MGKKVTKTFGLGILTKADKMVQTGKEIVEISDSQDSVELKQSAKGDISFSVKCYRETSDEASLAAKKTLAGLQAEYAD